MSSSPTEHRLAEVTMPQMGVSVAEGTIVEWRKRPGDWVEADEPIVQIDTDKVETEVPSPASGRVKEILVEVGQTVDVGTLLATIDTAATPGEAHADEHSRQAPVARAVRTSRRRSLRSFGASPTSTAWISRRCTGTGRRGRVTKKDLLAFIETGGNGKPAEPTLHMESPYVEETGPQPPAASGGEELSIMRKQIGEHMVRSLQTAAHCTTMVEADMSRIEAARGQALVPAVRRAGGDRGAARVPDAQRDARGRPPDRARRGAPRHRGLARRGRADRAGGAQRARALARGPRRAHQGPRRAGARQAPRARRGRRRHVHDHQPRALRGAAGHADHQPAAGGDPRPRGGREAAGRGDRRARQRLDRHQADDLPLHVVGPPRAGRRAGGAVPLGGAP